MKYIVVTGGVVSGLGKGVTISSIGRILKSSGLRVTSIKIDPYLNVDAGTMSPFEHGETFVLNDGGETDLDLGNYERFLDIQLTGQHNITSGKVYSKVIAQERRGDYLGKTVQIVPHATDVVQKWLKDVAQISVDGTDETPDVCLIEVGGTVGDIESMVFLEALRQFQFNVGRENIMFMHVSLVPVLGTVGEQKTKPTQHSVKVTEEFVGLSHPTVINYAQELRALGLSPDVIFCRSTEMLTADTQGKIASFCHVAADHIIAVHDVSNLYHVPLVLVKQGLHTIIKKHLHLEHMYATPNLTEWTAMAESVDRLSERVDIAVVGKYIGLSDSYLSVIKALKHSGILLNVDVNIQWVEAADLEETTQVSDAAKHAQAWNVVRAAKGVLVPGGFGGRGVEGKILAAKFARENKIPYLGVCLGLQVMAIEFARNVLGAPGANSSEFDAQSVRPVVVYMPEISPTGDMGGTMRLGARTTVITKTVAAAGGDRVPSLAAEVYGFVSADEDLGQKGLIEERHRHRYEVNPAEVASLEAAGLHFCGRDVEGDRMETAELSRETHPFYFAVQFHPEFKSRPNRPSPPFFALVAVSAGRASELGRGGVLWRENEERVRQEVISLQSPKKKQVASVVAAEESDISISLASPNKRSVLDAGFEEAATPRSTGRRALQRSSSVSEESRPAELVLPKPLAHE